MSTVAERPANFFERAWRFFGEVRNEMRKVTWPDKVQLRQATIAIIVFVLVISAVIAILDLVLQGILVRGIPSLFGGGAG